MYDQINEKCEIFCAKYESSQFCVWLLVGQLVHMFLPHCLKKLLMFQSKLRFDLTVVTAEGPQTDGVTCKLVGLTPVGR